MFSDETVVLDVEQTLLDQGPALLVQLFAKLSTTPKNAREKRSAFVISFDKAGISSAYRDARSQRFIAALVHATPYVGYFLNGDPPLYRLRQFSMALCAATPLGLTVESFLKAHQSLHEAATAHGMSLGDLPSAMEEKFGVNLVPEVLREDPKLQVRAMRALYPIFEQTRSASPQLRKLVFKEAEQIWGRSLKDFVTPDSFLSAFKEASK